VNSRIRAVLPTFAAIVAVALFCVAGVWQLRRAEEKRALQAEYDRRATEAPIVIGSERQSAEALQFHRIEATGRYEAEYQILLDNRMHQGVPGYHVLTPLRIADGEMRVLVNRGWVALGADRSQLPVIDPPAGAVTVRGIATVPHLGFTLGDPMPLSRNAPAVWQQPDLAHYAAEAPFPIQPVLVLLDPASEAGGLVRSWPRLDTGIAVHQAYAFQWFMLALAALVLYAVLTVRAVRRRSRS
jgi:surfeit locus 1 family protein